MPTDPRFGPLYSVHRAVADVIVPFLQERERQYTAAAERDAGWTPGMIGPPKSWNVTDRLDAIPGVENTPSIIVAVRGDSSEPRRSSSRDRMYSLPISVGVAVVTMGQDQANSRELAGVLSAGLLGAMLHFPTFGGDGRVHLDDWTGYRLDDLPPEDQRTRAIVRMEFVVNVKDVVQGGIGSRIPDPPVDPTPQPDPLHRVESWHIDVRKEGE
jgi:hypothetical protein